ncbi:MAG TPA: biotin/lipoyl-containing protein, partial [Steroidobacteraceae bacterium]|nr:biotin/lipoyl-containing protein [Steroidobacteraceae bacterium]
MTTEIRVPQLPESITDATLVAWHKQPGDAIRRDENLADLETDKVVLEVPAPANGVVRELRVKSGTVVRSGQVLAVIEEGAAASTKVPAEASGAPAAAAPAGGPAPPPRGAPAVEPGRDAGKLSPSARRLVEENRLDPAVIPASGRDGRITKADVVGFLDRAAAPGPPAAPVAGAAAAVPPPAPLARPAAAARAAQRVPMTRLRARIAQRLLEAQSTQALLTSFNEVDLT